MIRYHTIIENSDVDGPGRRIALFMQGCPIHCPGCQSTNLWPMDGGHEASAEGIADTLLAAGLPITISGGEPFAQPQALAELISILRDADADPQILIYTGYTIEILLGQDNEYIATVLNLADVLVDGPYIAAQDHDGMQWRGSPNQRPINLPATRATNFEQIITLDWDTPQIIISPEGNIIAAATHAEPFLELGKEIESRRCGESS